VKFHPFLRCWSDDNGYQQGIYQQGMIDAVPTLTALLVLLTDVLVILMIMVTSRAFTSRATILKDTHRRKQSPQKELLEKMRRKVIDGVGRLKLFLM
jgi:hypothetical protein